MDRVLPVMGCDGCSSAAWDGGGGGGREGGVDLQRAMVGPLDRAAQ